MASGPSDSEPWCENVLALLSVYRAISSGCRALFRGCRALLSVCRALLSLHIALFEYPQGAGVSIFGLFRVFIGLF